MSEIKMVEGKKLNSRLLEEIIKRRDTLFQKGHRAYTRSENVDLEEIDATNNKRIYKDDKEEYDCLHEIETLFLQFGNSGNGEQDTCQNDQVYDIPGVKVIIDGNEVNTHINVRQDKISALARKAKDYERILSKEGSLQIKFPNQIYQFNHDQTNIPGTTYKAPKPKLVSQTTEEYEESLKTFYHDKGIEREETEDKIWRKPYPHEYVDYKGAAADKKDQVQSEYYRFNFKAKQEIKAQRGKLRFTRQQVNEKTPLFTKLKNGVLGIGSTVKDDESARKKIKYVLATGGAIAAGTYFGITSGLLPAVLPVGGIALLYHWAKKKFDKMRKEKERNSQQDNQRNDGSSRSSNPTPQPPTPINPPTQGGGTPINLGEDLEENLQSLRQNSEVVTNIENRIAQLQHELDNLNPNTPNYNDKKDKLNQEITKLKENKRTILESLKEDITKILNSYQLGNEAGGPKL